MGSDSANYSSEQTKQQPVRAWYRPGLWESVPYRPGVSQSEKVGDRRQPIRAMYRLESANQSKAQSRSKQIRTKHHPESDNQSSVQFQVSQSVQGNAKSL